MEKGKREKVEAVGGRWLRVLQVVLLVPMLLLAGRLVVQKATFPQPPVYAGVPQQRILVVHNSADTYGERAYANVVRALDYARLKHDDLDLASDMPWPDLEGYSALVFVTEFLTEKIDEAQVERIGDYVALGGGLAVVYRGWHPQMAALLGMQTDAGYPELVAGEGGVRFLTDFFPGVDGLVLSAKTAPDLSPYDIRPRPEAQIIARSGTGRPIAWLHRYGQGRVLYWNTAFLAEKEARGFIVQSVLNVQPLGVLPIANFATIQIDDFPAAVSTEKIEPVKSEYDMTLVEFYDKVWFPDMMDIARHYGIVYTFLIPFNYNSLIEPPFDFREWEHAKVEVDGQQVIYATYVSHLLAQEHELGLHGYNHVSLTLENWPSEENMVLALREAWKRWEADELGPHPISYVPPNNIFDEAGARALTRGFPSLKILASIYSGVFEEGGNREFEPEPWNPQLFDIPRVAYGYHMTPRYRFAMLSALGMMGVWTHFIHPDDVVHTPENYPDSPHHRNPHYWPWRGDHTGEKNGFYYRFLRWLDFMETYYPWLRYIRTDESLNVLLDHLKNDVTVELKAHEVRIQMTNPTYFQVRINDGRRVDLNALEGAQFVHVYHGQGYTLYTLRALEQEIRLRLLIPHRATQSGTTRELSRSFETVGEEERVELADLQDERVWAKARVEEGTPTPSVAPTPSPALDVLPMSSPTPRIRP